MGAPKGRQAEFLDHFQLKTDPFSSGQEDLGFFDTFSLDSSQPFTFEQAIVYIQFSLNAAGSDNKITVEEGAFQALYGLTTGHIGRTKTIMDLVLHKAFKDGAWVINKAYIEDAFMDLPQENDTKRPGIKIIGLILIALVISIGLILLVFKGNDEKGRESTNVSRPAVSSKPQPPRTSLSYPAPEKAFQYSDKQVMDFLTAYNLEAYEPLFFSAIVSEDFRAVSKKIYSETGLMLIHFTVLPPMVKNQYDILKKILLNPVHTRYFLFWKPSIVVSEYENGVKGKSIRRLQILLKKQGLYNSRIDGIVDTELTRALIRFQGQRFLEQTGIPDSITLFFLTALSQ